MRVCFVWCNGNIGGTATICARINCIALSLFLLLRLLHSFAAIVSVNWLHSMVMCRAAADSLGELYANDRPSLLCLVHYNSIGVVITAGERLKYD